MELPSLAKVNKIISDYKASIELVTVLGWEFFCGKTKAFKASSTVEIIINVFKAIWRKPKQENQMLEGKELEKQLGEYGSVSVDVTPDLKVKVALEAHVDLLAEVEKLCKKTATPKDDMVWAWIEGLLKAAAAIG